MLEETPLVTLGYMEATVMDRNSEGEMLLEFAIAMDLVVTNTFFKKEEARTVTFESGGNKSLIDYVLVRRKERSMVRDVKVFNGEACIKQHKLVVCIVELREKEKMTQQTTTTTPRIKAWKLKNPEITEKFRALWIRLMVFGMK